MNCDNCDNCKYYKWYYDYCRKWDCKVDTREIHNCFESYGTPIRDKMINYEDEIRFDRRKWNNHMDMKLIKELIKKYEANKKMVEDFEEKNHNDINYCYLDTEYQFRIGCCITAEEWMSALGLISNDDDLIGEKYEL